MPCFRPLNAWQSPAGGAVVFSPSRSHPLSIQLPCGQCIGCRLAKSQMWATRCLHESSMHEDNCFITLTYDDDHLPWDGSLNKKHFQDFMKRFRDRTRKKIRYFHCGEYGEKLQRPHYHALIFGYDFEDKTLWSQKDGVRTYTSELLEKIWPFGFSTVGAVTWESAAYCARYVTKKQTGDQGKEHYWRILATDLEVELQPEYATMSLKPGIGQTWFTEYKNDCFPSDYITVNGKKKQIPRYYDKLLEKHNELDLATIKENRKREARKHHENNTRKRLRVREEVQKAKIKTLQRNLENETRTI